jgi:hypothetical protein
VVNRSHKEKPMTTTTSKPLPMAFEWRINAPHGTFTGEQKAEIAARMEEIALRIGRGAALVEIAYDAGSVIAKIKAKLAPDARQAAMAKAARDTGKGVRGLIAKTLLFWHGLGAPAREELVRRLAEDYLREEQGRATAELLIAFKTIIAHASDLGKVGA